jgi:hypothetical protein
MKKNGGGYLSIILAMSMGLLILHFIKRWDWPLIASLVIGMIGLLLPKPASAIAFGWKKFTMFIGFALQRIVLTVIFYVFLVPIAFASRIFRKRKPMQLSDEPGSTFIEVNKSFERKDFEKPW